MRQLTAVLALLTTLPVYAFDADGNWLGEVEFKGQTGSFGLHLAADGEGGYDASISMPPIEVFQLPVGKAQADGDGVTIGQARFTFRPETGTLVGTLPASLVPVYSIDIELERKTDWRPPVPADEPVPIQQPTWRVELGSPIYAGLVVSGEDVLVGADDGCLRALAIGNGSERWRFCASGPLRATPTVTADGVLLHADDGLLYRLDPSGAKRWSAAVEGKAVTRVPAGEAGSRYDHYGASAVVVQDRIAVGGHDGGLTTFDQAGQLLWRVDLGDSVTTPASDGQRLIAGSFDGAVHALDLHGRHLWRSETGAAVVSRPAVSDGRVVIGSRSYDVFALDLADGELLWSHYLWFSWIESSASVRDGIAYVGSSDAQKLLALEVRSGRPRWIYDTGGSAWATPAVSEATVAAAAVGVPDYIVDHRASLTAIDRDDGRPRWRYRPAATEGNHGFAAQPVIADGWVIAAGLDGTVVSFREFPPDP